VSRTEFADFRIDDTVLAQSDALLAAIVRSASDAIIAMDASGAIISWNYGAQLHFGFAESEMIGLHVGRFIPEDRRSEQEAALHRIFAGEMVPSFRTLRTAKTGQDLAVSVAMSPIHNADGAVVAASAIIRPRPPGKDRKADAGQGDLWDQLDDHEEARSNSRRSILVVEDEALIGLGLTSMLENAGFDVVGPAGDVQSAMALLDSHDCALAILDINLRAGETSAPLAQRLKQDGIPFFVTSGHLAVGQPAIFAEAPKFPKPFGAGKLMAAVQEVMG